MSDKLPVTTRDGRQRYAVVDTGFDTPCWIWKLCKTPTGYAKCADGAGSWRGGHQVYYERMYGAPPPGTELDHLCSVRACVNPEHLEAIPHVENIQRGRNAKVTPEQVREIRASGESYTALARQYGLSASQISRIHRRKSWKNVGDI
jgi:hypothetical protein